MAKDQIVLAVDLDGTLVCDNDNRIHPQDIALLRAGLPIRLILATGRSLMGARMPFEKSGLIDRQPLQYPLVLNNGGLLCAVNQRVVAHFPFEQAVTDELIRVAFEHPELTFLLQGQTEVYQINSTESGMRAVNSYGFIPSLFQPENRTMPISKLMALSDRKPDLEKVAAAFARLPLVGNYSRHDIYEVVPPGINKGEGLKKLLAILGLEDAILAVAGDGDNDACMIELADKSFAPLNGQDFIREMSDYVIDPRPHGLFAPILEKLL
jgi:Cof subfamily protein (haloacid dehalogenase superfamily)